MEARVTKVTSVDIIEYLREIDQKSKEIPEDDDGFRTSRQIAEKLGISIPVTRQFLREAEAKGLLVVQRVPRRILGGVSRVLAYKVKEIDVDDKA
jgi:ribosomal protein S25